MTPAPILKDQAARDIIRNSLNESLWVEAAAGTGKTTELVNRIVAVLRTGGAPIEAIAAVTFTNKAAGELKLRLRQKLDETREKVEGQEADHIANALERLEDASIGTIHSFCAQILRERPVEAGIDPAFVESADQESRGIFQRAFRAWFERALEDNPPGLRRALARLAWSDRGNESASERLQSAAWALVEWRDFPASWTRPPFDRDTEALSALQTVRALADEANSAFKGDDAIFRSLAPVRELAAWAERPEFVASPDYDTLEALLLDLPRKLFNGRFGRARQKVQDLKNRIEAFKRPADADLAALLRSEMSGVCEIYDDLKRKAGRLDFQDLLMRVRDLLRDNGEVRAWLQSRFQRIYVDEFQDTDPLQAEILLLLASDDPGETDWRKIAPAPGKLFAVGDPKQSIYKFRRADAQLYNEIRDRLAKSGVRRVELTSSFRSVAPLQDCINAAFEHEIVEDPQAGQAKYVPLDKVRGVISGQPAVIALPAPRPYGSRNVSKEAIQESLPDAIAAFVEWLLPEQREKRWKVCDPDSGKLRPMRGSDIAILFRKTIDYGTDLTRPLVRGLEAREIQHLLVGSKSFYEREEVNTLRTACEAVEWPDDELSVYATLHGALFAINDEILLRFRHEHGRLHPLTPRDGVEFAADFQPVVEALELLARLHRRRNRRAIADTIAELLDATRAHIGFAFRPGGHHALGNVYRVIDLARSFELEGGVSFRGFVEELNARASRADSAEAPMVEEAAEGVRIMTVHSAKGLEFPVVILADMTTGLSSKNPERYLDADRGLCAVRVLNCAPQDLLDNLDLERDRERAEGIRVAYVAATRARDLLVVPVVGDEERDGWLMPLNKALYPHPQHKRWASVPAGCPPFAGRSVLDRPVMASGDDISVKPGGHKPKVGSHEVVWWDPAALRLDAGETTGLPNANMLGRDSDAGIAEFHEWEAARAAALETASAPSCTILSPSETADGPPGDPIPVAAILCPRAPGRPSGRRFGTLVHQLLEGALEGSAGLSAAARSRARVIGAPDEETAAAIEAVETALRHPLIERARKAATSHRELPIAYRMDDGRIVEGNIDLAFEENGEWVVVDFKTDADFAGVESLYASQIRWYAYALSRLTGRRARCVLLGV